MARRVTISARRVILIFALQITECEPEVTLSGTTSSVSYVGLVDAVWQPQAQDHVLGSTTRFIYQGSTQHFDSPSHDQASKQLPTPPQQIRQRLGSSSSSHEARHIFLDNEENSSTYQTKKSATSDKLRNSHRKISISNFPPTTLLLIINITTTTPTTNPISGLLLLLTTHKCPPRIHSHPTLYTLHGLMIQPPTHHGHGHGQGHKNYPR